MAQNGEPPSFILKISCAPNGRLESERDNPVGSIVVSVDLRPVGGRY